MVEGKAGQYDVVGVVLMPDGLRELAQKQRRRGVAGDPVE